MTGVGADTMPRMWRALTAAALVATSASWATAQDATRSGGFVPAPRKSRDELIREWDLNSDGTIDPGEAEVAASRMRRERAQMRLKSGIDPVTGLPRGFELPALDADAAAKQAMPEDEQPAPRKPDRPEAKPLPGTRVTLPKLPGRATTEAEPEAAAGKSGISGTRADADRRRQALTGGVRGGGVPARAGYGASVPAPPLNAGLPIPPKTRPTTAPPAQPRGGLVPAPRTASPAPTLPPPRSGDLYDPY